MIINHVFLELVSICECSDTHGAAQKLSLRHGTGFCGLTLAFNLVNNHFSFRGWKLFFHDVHIFVGLRLCSRKSSNFKFVKNTQIAHNSLLRARRGLWGHLWTPLGSLRLFLQGINRLDIIDKEHDSHLTRFLIYRLLDFNEKTAVTERDFEVD